MAVLAQSHFPVTRSELPWAIRQGAIGGIVAGVAFGAFEMIASAAMMGAPAMWMPPRMIGAILLGPAALEPGYSLAAAAVAGLAVHMVLAVAYGAIFAALLGGLRRAAAIVSLATAYGFALWLVNFYVIARSAFPWFLQANPMVQFVGHTFFFGTVLGLYLWRAHERLLEQAV